MKRRTTSLFKKLMYERYFLNEAEKDDKKEEEEDDPFGAGDGEGEDEPADDEGDSGGGSEEEEEAPADDSEEESAEGSESEDPTKKLTPEQEEEVAKKFAEENATEQGGKGGSPPVVLDPAISELIRDAAKKAEKAAKGGLADNIKYDLGEAWWRKNLTTLLFEADEMKKPLFDLNVFSGEVEKLIDNYDTLLDIPFIIYTKAYDHIVSSYGEAMADQFKSVMDEQYGINFDEEEEVPTVYAVGAKPSGTA